MKAIFVLLIIFIFSLNILAQNNEPQFTSSPVTIVDEFELYEYHITASDLDDDSLIYSYIELPSWLTLIDYGNDSALLTGTPIEYLDSNYVTLSLNDETDTVFQSFNIEISCINEAPQITTFPDTVAYIDSLYNYEISGIDVTGNVLFRCDTLPNWLTLTDIGYNNAILSGIPTISDTGIYEIIIEVYREFEICITRGYQIFNLVVKQNLSTDIKNNNTLDFQLFPNPSQNEVFLYLNNYDGDNITVQVINIYGKLIKEYNLKYKDNILKINTSNIPVGCYIIRIFNETRGNSIIRKMSIL